MSRKKDIFTVRKSARDEQIKLQNVLKRTGSGKTLQNQHLTSKGRSCEIRPTAPPYRENLSAKKLKQQSAAAFASPNVARNAIRSLQSAMKTLSKESSVVTDSDATNDDDEDDNMHVHRVLLPKVASEINKLTELKILNAAEEADPYSVYQVDLHGQKIAKIECFERFKKLRVLDLSCNVITVIDNLQNNQDMRELRLYDNSICEISNLESLTELVTLNLQANRIDRIGKGLLFLRKLKTLRLDSNFIHSIDSREITSLGQLTSLDLSSNRLTDIGAINFLSSLEELTVKNNRLSTVADLHGCRELKEVDLSGNQLTDLTGLRSLPKLSVVNVSHNHLKTLRSIGKLKCLQELDASYNELWQLMYIPEFFPNLEILNVSSNKIEAWDEVKSLSRLPELVELEICYNPAVPEEVQEKPDYIQTIQDLVPNLELVDGMMIKSKRFLEMSRPSTPLMRPMTPHSVISVKQVEDQVQFMKEALADMENDLYKNFERIKTDISMKLPEHVPQTPQPTIDDAKLSSRRQRLQAAVDWALSLYQEDEQE